MMLSVLIPTYNYDFSNLLADLHQQCEQSGCDYEILVYDDGSKIPQPTYNPSGNRLPHTIVRYLPQNTGRSKIRNMLANDAKGEWLLFIDCDAQVTNKDFIQTYLSELQDGHVICGGTAYSTTPPDTNHILRWTYGIEREGNASYSKNFTTFNFAIQRDLFNTIRFDESLSKYGHEDTVFQLQLNRHNIPISHINNPLLHCGLDTNTDYLNKIKISNQNLLQLWESGNYPELTTYSKLLKHYATAKRHHYMWLIKISYRIIRKAIINNLTGYSPSMLLLDIYKLGELCSFIDK